MPATRLILKPCQLLVGPKYCASQTLDTRVMDAESLEAPERGVEVGSRGAIVQRQRRARLLGSALRK